MRSLPLVGTLLYNVLYFEVKDSVIARSPEAPTIECATVLLTGLINFRIFLRCRFLIYLEIYFFNLIITNYNSFYKTV